ncbi:MAG: response regulator, partial [Calditrichae bacterium]|nr:response regulator [Calditrichia bacterium]
MPKLDILAVDDEKEMLVSYQKILKRAGYGIHTCLSAEKALEKLKENHKYSLVICDLKMPGMDGMEFLTMLKNEHPHLPLIMVTGFGTVEIGIEAVKKGAFDFLEKPFSSKKLLASIQEALNQIAPAEEVQTDPDLFDNMVGKSEPMQNIFEMIRKVSYRNANILITGESGVGKELIARSVHKPSLRR